MVYWDILTAWTLASKSDPDIRPVSLGLLDYLKDWGAPMVGRRLRDGSVESRY